jgi:hypothetical protein
VSVNDFAVLEERVLRAVALVKQERQAGAAEEAREAGRSGTGRSGFAHRADEDGACGVAGGALRDDDVR